MKNGKSWHTMGRKFVEKFEKPLNWIRLVWDRTLLRKIVRKIKQEWTNSRRQVARAS